MLDISKLLWTRTNDNNNANTSSALPERVRRHYEKLREKFPSLPEEPVIENPNQWDNNTWDLVNIPDSVKETIEKIKNGEINLDPPVYSFEPRIREWIPYEEWVKRQDPNYLKEKFGIGADDRHELNPWIDWKETIPGKVKAAIPRLTSYFNNINNWLNKIWWATQPFSAMQQRKLAKLYTQARNKYKTSSQSEEETNAFNAIKSNPIWKKFNNK